MRPEGRSLGVPGSEKNKRGFVQKLLPFLNVEVITINVRGAEPALIGVKLLI